MDELRQLFEKNAAAFRASHRIIGTLDSSALWQSLSDSERAALAEGVEKKRWLLSGRLLHSERDARREAARAAQNLVSARALIAVSAGAGYLFAELSPATRDVLLIEPSPFLVAAFFLANAFALYHGTITLYADRLERAESLEEILPWLQGKNLKKTLIYCHAASLAADKPLYTRAYERVVALFEKRSVNQATIVKFQRLWNKNIFLNQRTIWQAATLNELLATSAPQAIVLAGAGPSLSASFAGLKKFRERFFLMAADTALVPLNKAGIFPDLVLAADPQWLNHFFAQSPHAHRSAWLMDPVVCPAIPHRLATLGAPMAFWNNVFAADQLFRTEDRGDVAHGGSVSTNAFDVAVQWLMRRAKAQPGRIILVGQDLSFSNRQAHCRGAVLESAVYLRSNRLGGMELHNYRQMTAMPVLWEKGIRQEKVRTNGKLKIFLDWFTARAAETDKARVRLINATDDGAYLRGFDHLTLEAALADLGSESIRALWPVKPAREGNRARAEKLIGDLGEVARLTKENSALARRKSPDAATLNRLNENDAALKRTGIAREIAGLNAQALILRITEQGEDADAAQFYGALAQAAREVAHWARRML